LNKGRFTYAHARRTISWGRAGYEARRDEHLTEAFDIRQPTGTV